MAIVCCIFFKNHRHPASSSTTQANDKTAPMASYESLSWAASTIFSNGMTVTCRFFCNFAFIIFNNDSMQLIKKYFPDLSADQLKQLEALDGLYRDWNSKINVISRKDIDNLYEPHVLHSLAIAKFLHFRPGTQVRDLGTGAGFPGIPLAILFPDTKWRLIDGTGKKINVAKAVAEGIGLTNVEAVHRRGEDEHDKFDFVVSRAVMPLPDLVKIVRKNISGKQRVANALPNGIITLKGGNIDEEIKPFSKVAEVTPVSNYFSEEWFKEKYIIYLPL